MFSDCGTLFESEQMQDHLNFGMTLWRWKYLVSDDRNSAAPVRPIQAHIICDAPKSPKNQFAMPRNDFRPNIVGQATL